jgi:hypothetical protein
MSHVVADRVHQVTVDRCPDAAADRSNGSARTPRIPGTVVAIVAAVVVTLIAVASRYGYHRDELYFLAAGRHLDWAYPDQGPLTPLIARIMSAIAPDSLTVLRLPSALAAGATVLLTSQLAAELGGRRRAQSLAAAVAAVAVIVLFTGHILSTTTFDLLVWTAVTWLAVRAVRTGADRLWLVAGVVLGVGLLNKPLPAFLAAAMLAGLALSGPRRVLHSRQLWLGAVITIALCSPWVVWQAAHGWPQLAVSRSIAAGGSTSSAPWWQIIPFQALLAGPVLAPVWIAGLIRLLRDTSVRYARFLAYAWGLLAVLFMVSGGKPYYLAGLLPVLVGAGATPLDRWLDGGRRGTRRLVFGTALVVSTVAGVLIALPVLPARHAGPMIAANPDVGETLGWPQLVRTVAGVREQLPRTAEPVVLTANYGEAGAIDRFGPEYGLPHAYSGHNGYGLWGSPPEGAGPVIAVGFNEARLATQLRGCATVAHIDNRAGVDNNEEGQPVVICAGPRGSWAQQWPKLRRLG